MSKLDYRLKSWGVIRMHDENFADEYGENILYRCGVLQGRVDEPIKRDKVLCPDRKKWFRDVDKAVNRLPFAQKNAIYGWYCVPIKENGNPMSIRQLSDLLSISTRQFDKNLKSAMKRLRKLL